MLPLWVGLHLSMSPTPVGELVFFVLLAGIGFVTDSVLIKLGLFTMNDLSSWAPMWLVSMWILLGLTYESMLTWRRKTWLLLLIGGMTGPLTYVWCEAVHLLMYARPLWESLAVHGLLWAVATPALFWVRDISLMATSRRTTSAPHPQEFANLLAALERELQAPVSDRAIAPDWMEPSDHHKDATPPTLH